MRTVRFFCLLFCSVFLAFESTARTPVILRVLSSEQQDTTGCNFVEELLRVGYREIMEGRARLWNAQSKDIQILPSSLLSIDAASGTDFLMQDKIYIYEYWDNENGQLSSTTGGFLFSNVNKSGENIEYGYVEYSDLQPAFQRERLRMNPNGNYNATLSDFLNSKSFNYNIIQFAGKVIDNVTESRRIRSEFVGNARFNVSAFTLSEIQQKMVLWTLDFSGENEGPDAEANLLARGLEQFLTEHEDLFFDLGGYEILYQYATPRLRITRIQVQELWKKIDGQILSDPVSILLFMNDSALAELSFKEIFDEDIRIADVPLTDILRKKEFNYVIRRINNTALLRTESYPYQKALIQGNWNNLTGYVKSR